MKELIIHGVGIPTVTLAVAVIVLVSPTAVRRYTFVEVSGPVPTDPVGKGELIRVVEPCVIAWDMQPVVDQLRVEDPPEATVAGTALNEIIAHGARVSSSAETVKGLLYVKATTIRTPQNMFS